MIVNLISGLGEGLGGAGQLIEEVRTEIKQKDLPLRLLLPKERNGFRSLLKQGRLLSLIRELRQRIQFQKEWAKIALKEEPLILMHPATLGYRTLIEVIEKRVGLTWIYVLDASFFCRMYYNVIIGEFSPCYRCLGGDTGYANRLGCKFLPPFGGYDDFHSEFLDLVRRKPVGFFAQNLEQEKLLKKHYGTETRVKVIGMKIPESDPHISLNDGKGYDIVYHGTSNWAKGLPFVLRLAEAMPEFSFLIPEDRDRVMSEKWFSTFKNISGQVHFHQMRWLSGLKNEVQRAKIVICPSVWAAPIEGAVIKSIANNGVVAVFRGEGQYGKEIPQNCCVELNFSDLPKTVLALKQTLMNDELRQRIRENAKQFLNEYNLSCTGIAEKMYRIASETFISA